jgi:hypothetical protein
VLNFLSASLSLLQNILIMSCIVVCKKLVGVLALDNIMFFWDLSLKSINLTVVGGGVSWVGKNDSANFDFLLMGDSEIALEAMLKARTLSPKSIPRQNIFYTNTVLDLKNFVKNVDLWNQAEIKPGDTYINYFLMNEFLLAEFRPLFLTLDQYQSWRAAIGRAVLGFGQSIESFFLNSDGTLNYLDVIEAVRIMVAKGVMNPIERLIKISGEDLQPHVQYSKYLAMLSSQ